MKSIILIIFAIISTNLLAQNTYVPFDKATYELIDRYEIKNGGLIDNLHTSYKPYRRADVIGLYDSIYQQDSSISKVDAFNMQYLLIDNWQFADSGSAKSEKPLLKHFYKTKSDFYSVDKKGFKLRVNPVLYWGMGKESGGNNSLYTNTRGIQVEGQIDDKIGFYTFMADNQIALPGFVNNRVDSFNVVPGQGFWKRFKQNGVDFFTARGYFTFNISKHIDAQFGHDKNFIGNGYRSLILSDFAPNYLFLKVNTKIWKFNYTNLFAEMNAEAKANQGDRVLEKKYLALHHLSLNVFKNFNLGIWEATTFGRSGRYFDLQYLNPIIFYRSVEQQIGSGDNALLGLDYKWNFLKHFQLYGQVVLDEFLLNDFKSGEGRWTNKQALQIGSKYIDVAGISNLDIQAEFNLIRPYTYSHTDTFKNFTHYLQPLAHPIGSNLKEIILIGRYQPLPKLTLNARAIITQFGLDTDSSNWGTNVLANYFTREQEFGNYVGQGVKANLIKIDLTATYQLKHNLFFDLKITSRKLDASIDVFDQNTTVLSGAMRLNINQRSHDF